jgi:hypothetical protein
VPCGYPSDFISESADQFAIVPPQVGYRGLVLLTDFIRDFIERVLKLLSGIFRSDQQLSVIETLDLVDQDAVDFAGVQRLQSIEFGPAFTEALLELRCSPLVFLKRSTRQGVIARIVRASARPAEA